MKKNLYIHIGTGKTGTTAIQNFLDINNNLLQNNYDIKYADTYKQNHVHHALCSNFNRKVDFNIHHEITKRLEELKDEMNISNCNNFIISSENFPGITKEDIKQLYIKNLSEKFNIHIITYIRKQDEYIESWYAQLIKTERYKVDLDNLTDELFDKGLLNYYEMLSKWSTYIDSKNIHVKVYEKEQFYKGNIFNDFMSIFNITDIKGFQLPPKDSNPSLTLDQILIIKAFDNTNLTHFMDDVIKKPFDFEKTKNLKLLSPQKRQDILLRCENSNAKIAFEFLKRNDGKLFNNYSLNQSENWEETKYPKTEYIIRTFTHLLAKQKIHFTKEINSLKEEIENLKENK